MTIEREITNSGRMPKDVYDQIRDLPDFSRRETTCEELFGQIFSLLDAEGIGIDITRSGFRAKTDARIIQKISERQSSFFLRDIFGLWVVVEKDLERALIPGIISPVYSATPEFFADGTPSVRDYSIPEVKIWNRNRNKNISDEYSALHVNGVFDYGGNRLGIFELKVFTKAEDKLYEMTRQKYELNRSNGRGV